ncbi:MAG: hypothetical protein ACP5L4_02365 [Thermoplasmata archaeon]
MTTFIVDRFNEDNVVFDLLALNVELIITFRLFEPVLNITVTFF